MRFSDLGRLPLWIQRCAPFYSPWALSFSALLGRTGEVSLHRRDREGEHRMTARELRRILNMFLDRPEVIESFCFHQGLIHFLYQGHRFSLRNQDFPRFQEIWLGDRYRLQGFANHFETVVDLGAGAGLFTLLVVPQAERVVAVEASRENRQLALWNFSQSVYRDRVTMYDRLMSGVSGETRSLFLGSHPESHSVDAAWIREPASPAAVEEVETLSLADLFEQESIQRCDLLKCDIEGAEYEVLFSAPEAVLRQIDRLALEIHLQPDLQWDTPNCRQLARHLKEVGFHLYCGPLDKNGHSARWFGVQRYLMETASDPRTHYFVGETLRSA
jgi:FkbM family methyltransferase